MASHGAARRLFVWAAGDSEAAVRTAMETAMRYVCAFALMLTIAIPTAAFAHGVVGDYVFLEPLIAEDPTPANEFDIVQPSWNKTSGGQNFSLGYAFEKVLYQDDDFMPRFSVGASNAWHYQWPKNAPDQQGFDDLEMFVSKQFGPGHRPEAAISESLLFHRIQLLTAHYRAIPTDLSEHRGDAWHRLRGLPF